MTVEVAKSSRSQPVTTGAVSTVLGLFVEIGAAIKAFFRGSHPASAGSCTESPVVETEAVATVQVRAPAEAEQMPGSALSPTMNSTSKKSSVDATWYGLCSMIFGVGCTKSRSRSWSGSTRLKIMSTSD
jgi:hypothetical protein